MEDKYRYLHQMNYLKDLDTGLPDKSTALLVRRDGRVILCAGAVRMLGLSEGRMRFKEDNGRIYLGKSADPNFGYQFRQVGNELRVKSKRLARLLSESLDGYGDYRIDPEDTVLIYPGIEYYRVFQKNYNK